MGLLTREPLVLTLLQQVVIAANAGIWLTCRRIMPAALLTGVLSWWAFWHVAICFDTRLTWHILSQYAGRTIPLSEIGFLPHLQSNPPLWSWYVSTWPGFLWQQTYAIALSGLIVGLCWRLYGATLTRLIAATPLCQLCVTQPLPGLYALGCILAGRRLWQMGHKTAALMAIAAAMCWKYTVYALMPFFVWEFRTWSLGLVAGGVVYWWRFAASDTLTYAFQRDYLLSQYSFCLSWIPGMMERGTVSTVSEGAQRAVRVFLWHKGLKCLKSTAASGWYLAPMAGAMPLYAGIMAGIMLLGGGNVKYLVLIFGVLPEQHG